MRTLQFMFVYSSIDFMYRVLLLIIYFATFVHCQGGRGGGGRGGGKHI
jgi:hypothetical protein